MALVVPGKHGRGLFPGWFWIGIGGLTLAVVLLATVTAVMAVTSTKLAQARKEVIQQAVEIKRLKGRNEKLTAENDNLKETSKTLEDIKDRVFEINRRRSRLQKWAALPDRGGNWIGRIDQYLARTPLQGEGRTFYMAAVDAGIEPRLMPAIAMIESGGGRANANRNNFFGRKAVGGGWAAWASREEAINNEARYIAKMWGQVASPYEMRGYAIPGGPWMSKISREMGRI